MSALVLILALTGCKKDDVTVTDTDDTGVATVTDPGEVGDACTGNDDCRGDLVCASDLACALDGAPGTAAALEECFASVECQAGLVCDAGGLCNAAGGPGTAGVGETCAVPEDCQSALSCFEEQCWGFDVPLWEGIDCPDQETPFRVRFQVPRGGGVSDLDYMTLPFPNDIRVSGTALDMGGYPVSALPFLDAGDVSSAFVSAYGTEFPGFGPNQTVFLRLSTWPTFDTVLVGLPGEGSVSLVDIDSTSPSYGTRHPTGWKVTSNLPYLCDPWIALYPSVGRPFLAGRTYAAVITTDLLGEEGETPVQDPDFAAMLGGPPTDGALQDAWEAYAPLREWLTSASIDPGTIAGAAVFTIQDPAESATRIRDVVRGSTPPSASAVVQCEDLPGPHADPVDGTRGCFGQDAAFHEIQGALDTPHFQSGTRPFKTVADGGSAGWASGQPTIESIEGVTFAITVPTGPAPVDGWPVVLYAHDHAGNYRSFVADGLAADWSDVLLSDGTQVGFAVVSVDTWLTGPRRGPEDATWIGVDAAAWEPTVLYQSPLNPLAARDNITQSAGDWFQMVRYLESVDWTGADSPTGTPIAFDLSKVYFVGHGIGAKAGPLVVAREDAVSGAVFANGGAYWVDELAETEAPVRLAGYLAPALADPAIDRFQAILNLGQGIVDRTDPLNQARYVHLDASSADKHVLQVFAYDDPWVPEGAQYALARGLFTQQVVQNGLQPLEAIDDVNAPVSSNVGPATAVTVVNQGADPHRLLLEDARTQAQVREFLGTAVRDGTPTVPSVP